MLNWFALSLFFLCWGSFLNVLGYRLIKNEWFFNRSYCPQCKSTIAWYDNIPVLSYLWLGGSCRSCKQPISLLYPFIELLTLASMLALYYTIDHEYFLANFIFFSALIVTIRSDLETMYISRFATLPFIAIGLLFSITDQTTVLPIDSAMGAALGYASLWLIGTLFYAVTKKQGIGEGDFELLATIGAFTGIFGVWATVLIGSITGTILSLTYLALTDQLERHAKIPFGPFLAAGAMLYVLLHEHLLAFLAG